MRAVTSKLCSDPEGEFIQIKYQDELVLRTLIRMDMHSVTASYCESDLNARYEFAR